jgi:peptidoglycan/xylan/chitin deacetylase (PgdA/CDA1 family)
VESFPSGGDGETHSSLGRGSSGRSLPSSSEAVPLAEAEKCDPKICKLPNCRCGSPSIPGGLKAKQVPQIVMITFDDAINDLNWEIYEEIFHSGRKNPNGCPPLGTFYVSHEWTDYSQVQTLYSYGHEMASHGVTHSFGEKFSIKQWTKEVQGQREILHLYGGVKMEDVRGMRAPFLQVS